MRVWIDMTAPAHVLVFRPLIELLREQGAEIELTARDYAQTLQLLELHGMEAEVVGHHGGRSRLGKARSLTSRLRNLRHWAKGRQFDVALAHGSHELTISARRLGIPSSTTFDYEWATLQHQLGCRAATRVVVPESIPPERLERYGVRPPKLRRYPGLKEEYYLSDFEPDHSIIAALGVPVYTTFGGRLGGVAEWLLREGRLVPLTDPRALDLSKREPDESKRGRRDPKLMLELLLSALEKPA